MKKPIINKIHDNFEKRGFIVHKKTLIYAMQNKKMNCRCITEKEIIECNKKLESESE